MLRRKPTRIELKPEDKEEFEAARKEQADLAAANATAEVTSSGKQPLSSVTQAFNGRCSSIPCISWERCRNLCHQHYRVLTKTERPNSLMAWSSPPSSHQRKLTESVKYRSCRPLVSASSCEGQEVEIKLRLANKEAHDRVAAALSASLQATHQQENYFFDGAKQELTNDRSILRCRFYNHDKRALVTCKGQQKIVDGIGKGTELETDVDPVDARNFLKHPQELLALDIDFVRDICKKLSVQELVCLGGFRNNRKDFSWEGFKLELDETMFDWGTVYEIEVETEEPEKLKVVLEKFLQQQGIEYKYSTVTKFHNFMSKSLI